MFALLSKCRQKHLHQSDLRRRLFNILVEPVLSYGCQVWAPVAFGGSHLCDALKNDLEAVQQSFLRISAGLGTRTHRYSMLLEFGHIPLMHHWIPLAARLWNKLAALDTDDCRLAFHALRADLHLMLVDRCSNCWSHRFLHTMCELGLASTAQFADVESCLALQFDESDIKAALHDRFTSFIVGTHQHPRSAHSRQVTGSTYRYWIGMKGDKAAPHVKKDLTWYLRRLLVRMRLGCHDLRICTGHFEHPPLPRPARTCQVHQGLDSSLSAVEDLAHFLLECPAYSYIRSQYLAIFRPAWSTTTLAAGLRTIFMTKQQATLADCLERMLRHRTAVLQGLASPDDPVLQGWEVERAQPLHDPLSDPY
jgi:hypothetical protein